MNERKAITMAALFARTNIGHEVPSIGLIKVVRLTRTMSLTTAVKCICQEFIESDKHFAIFVKEAQTWYDRFIQQIDEEFAEAWPDQSRLYLLARAKRYENAIAIQKGAVNLGAICRSIIEAQNEVHLEHGNTHTDEAIRLMVHQIAYITGNAVIDGELSVYSNLISYCRDKINVVAPD